MIALAKTFPQREEVAKKALARLRDMNAREADRAAKARTKIKEFEETTLREAQNEMREAYEAVQQVRGMIPRDLILERERLGADLGKANVELRKLSEDIGEARLWLARRKDLTKADRLEWEAKVKAKEPELKTLTQKRDAAQAKFDAADAAVEQAFAELLNG